MATLLADKEEAGDIKQQYCVEQLNVGGCGEPVNYNVFKGPFEAREEIVLNCTEKSGCINITPFPALLEFYSRGEFLAKMEYVGRVGCCGEVTHKLVTPDVVGDRRIAEIRSNTPFLGRKLSLSASPYYKSASGYSAFFKSLLVVIIISCLPLEFIAYAFFGNLVVYLSIIGLCFSIIMVSVVLILCWRFRVSCTAQRKLTLLELVSITGGKKYADIRLVSKF